MNCDLCKEVGMEGLMQKDIDCLNRICEKYGLQLLLPPVFGNLNVCIITDEIRDLTHLYESLFFNGFSFSHKLDKGKSYVEILGYNEF